MTCILKYSGSDRDYFILTTKRPLKPYECIVHEISCKDQNDANQCKQNLYNEFVELGLIANTGNMTHLRTISRDAFRLHLLNKYKIDMMSIERKMNEKYMEMEETDSSDDEIYESVNTSLVRNTFESSSDDESNANNEVEEDYNSSDEDLI